MTDQTDFDRFSLPNPISPEGDIPDARDPLTGETKEERLERVLAEHGYRLKESGEGEEDDLSGPQASGGEDCLFGPQAPGAGIRPLGSSQKLGRPVGLASPSARGSSPDREGCSEAAPATFGNTEALDPQRMADFLTSMQTLGNVSIACKRAGIARQTAYRARRRHPGFARAWDAALVAARTVAESELAERAIHGVEESVFYHGEEVATRRRYDARLLLAHLARLDKAAERLDVAATLPQLDDWIAALREGGSAEEVLPARVDRDALRAAQEERDWIANPRAAGEREQEERASGLQQDLDSGDSDLPQDTVTPVTPCADCGGLCEDAEAELGPDDCMWLGNRLDRMDAARPAGEPGPHQLGKTLEYASLIEDRQLRAFEAGEEAWWLIGREDEDEQAGAEGLSEGAGEGAVPEGGNCAKQAPPTGEESP